MFVKGMLLALSGAALALASSSSYAFGEEGHSIIAEIAQRRLDAGAQAAVSRLLGASMSSVASWADDVRSERPQTYNWHFVDIPIGRPTYDPAVDCPDTGSGDCVVKELARLRSDLTCAPTADLRREALKFAIHFVGDVHQPLHTVLEKKGANGQKIAGKFHTPTCSDGCDVAQEYRNLHTMWDTGLIRFAYYDWGAYVEVLEQRILKDPAIQAQGHSIDPVEWALQTHATLNQVWSDTTQDVLTLDDEYYKKAMPVMDKQLALAGLHLAAFLNQAFATSSCKIAPQQNIGDLKIELKNYYTEVLENGSTRYEMEQAAVAQDAKKYLLEHLADNHPGKPAIVLDIDETSLNNLEQLKINDFGYIAKGSCTFKPHYACATEDWEKGERATAVQATKQLFQVALENHVAVFFVTGRRDVGNEKAITKDNLKKAGYVGFTDLYLRPDGAQGGESVGAYKSSKRADIEAHGYRIVVNVGDQPSDLAGGHAEMGFQMPNPFYRIP